jgi:hypothetical protein
MTSETAAGSFLDEYWIPHIQHRFAVSPFPAAAHVLLHGQRSEAARWTGVYLLVRESGLRQLTLWLGDHQLRSPFVQASPTSSRSFGVRTLFHKGRFTSRNFAWCAQFWAEARIERLTLLPIEAPVRTRAIGCAIVANRTTRPSCSVLAVSPPRRRGSRTSPGRPTRARSTLTHTPRRGGLTRPSAALRRWGRAETTGGDAAVRRDC